ncbi:DDB1- and CUL4-associated factor 10 homolog [Anopheles merus]|uniref:WD_REPEATS_REGION domain-containing protein n=1 Tax=Anopheles merus TaxID=30066 RepID=A0A182UN89_ANOME|nr:DDB1- and CUL4-associated factor 10 homolog [Anopheles merus]XP_041773348.1 DDB1- and CUL4-associated factor 10 homolog [Anopheles merus]XP_041773354.1 DDB1- and CUL4-associated factor 10 homolog [Anopheles merus]XP_041773362.1 DDB1- and CUL4-associated factor 10 homolog [Anopheles merus]XP_041773372.1 DDB1- and CUL4-associated factor 10 homolog [Anopheles merus]XP_041773381.1 DDB1- and CUL4-associated factor 10 homolog [Anopheles merus]XP_041773390.1 DDB1- and CUL4-associated factor 10 ho
MSLHEWYRRRERGLPARIGDTDMIYRTIFRSLQPRALSAELSHPYRCGQDSGAICNLEFSPDGTLLAAACEYKSIVLFDPLAEKQVSAVSNAHDGSVNCIKFVDSRTFASCSDDTTVALWDARNLSTKLRTLRGHSGWVKNIEYARGAGVLLSSGLDGLVYAWELNNSTEQGCTYQRLLYMPGLMRCRLAPDESRLVLCTGTGYLMLVHDLDLASLAGDLVDFRPNIQRLNLMRKQRVPLGARKTPAVSHRRKRNRIEFVSDFPPGDDAEMISGLTLHPQGWCALSRNISYDEKTEWSVVHDIQSWSENEDESDTEKQESDELNTEDSQEPVQEDASHQERSSCNRSMEGFGRDPKREPSETVLTDATWCNGATERNVINNAFPSHSGAPCSRLAEVPMQPTIRLSPPAKGGRTGSAWSEPVASKRTAGNGTDGTGTRLLYYIQESNKVEGYMREACFSPDGRVICSPHDDYGVRLLAFNEQCNEMRYARQCLASGSEPAPLRELRYKPCYPHVVISSQFSPRFPLLVTGCLLGNVVWNLPVLS